MLFDMLGFLMYTWTMRTISDQIRRAITASGLHQVELAAKSGVDQGRISRFMAGKRSITLNAADALCRVLRLELCQRPARKRGPK